VLFAALRGAPCVLRHLGLFGFPGAWDLVTYTDTFTQELTPDAEIVSVRFAKTVIASKSAFTYEEAQIRKDDK
jgi:hypothetical protein